MPPKKRKAGADASLNADGSRPLKKATRAAPAESKTIRNAEENALNVKAKRGRPKTVVKTQAKPAVNIVAKVKKSVKVSVSEKAPKKGVEGRKKAAVLGKKKVSVAKGAKSKAVVKGKRKVIKGKAKGKKAAPVIVVPLTEEELKKRERSRRNWEGNSDSEGSVDSGVLEENICYECGELTADLPAGDWEGLIICDRCDLEYHTLCVGFEKGDMLPRRFWQCPKCVEEERAMSKLDFTFPNCREIFDALKMTKRKVLDYAAPLKEEKADRARRLAEEEAQCRAEAVYARTYGKKVPIVSDICYSPSRPLELAWTEGASKGFMMVSRVLPYEVMRKLTHGSLETYTASGRVCDRWDGFVQELTNRINAGGRNIVNRGGRWDITLPKFVVDQLELPKLLEPITRRLCSIMKQSPAPQLRTHNIVLAPIGSLAQQWHSDDTMSKLQQHRYFTILIHLNTIGTFA